MQLPFLREIDLLQPDPSIRKVLIFRLGSLGDTVVALPSLRLIARSFPNAERIMLTTFSVHAKAPAVAAVLGETGLVHGYMRYTVGTRNPFELFRLAMQIRRYRPDLLIYLLDIRPLKSARRDRRFFRYVAGVRHMMGFPGQDGLDYGYDPATGLYGSEASRLARLIANLGDAELENPSSWSLDLNATERAAAAAALGSLQDRPLMVCGPGTKMQAKDWGQDNWRALLAQLSFRYPHYGLALLGAAEDRAAADYAANRWTGPKVNLCGRLSPRETAAVLEHAAIFLGPDSGPMHLAASAGVPCVIAFSARGLPGTWFPFGAQHRIVYHRVDCFGCRLNTCIDQGRRCLTSITVEEMAEAVAGVLDRRTDGGRIDSALTPRPHP